jgi:GDP-L-fucose synthase
MPMTLSDHATVFVAGGAGMAGTAIVEALLRRRLQGRIRASYRSTPPAVEDPRVEHVAIDLADSQALRSALRGCDAAVLAASEGGGSGSLAVEPWRQVTPNLLINAAWLQALSEAGVQRAVIVGSATCYQPCDGPIQEDRLDWNQDPSPEAFGPGWVTRSTEKLCEFWTRSAGLDIVRVRAANIYGPRARFDPARSNFIPALIRKASDRLDPFEVWGSPDVVRDVIFSADFGETIARLLEAPAAAGQVFNVGAGVGVSVRSVVKAALSAASYENARVHFTSSGPSTARQRLLDCGRVRALLGWEPTTSVEDGIRITTAWWLANRSSWHR